MNRLSAAVLALALALPAAAQEPSAEEFLAGTQSSGPSLRMYGFADVSYSKWLVDDKNSWWPLVQHNGAFAVGNMNVYLDGTLSKNARALVEFRLTYLPNGAGESFDPSTGRLVRNGGTYTTDYNYGTFGRTTVGGVVVERAWAEWRFNEYLTLRAGQFLTPVGIWIVDHGSPAIIAVQRPYVIASQLFPEHQVGIEAYGSKYLGSVRLGWHLTASNGRYEDAIGTDFLAPQIHATAQYTDADTNVAFGGRLFAESSALLGELKLGASYYQGRFTTRTQGIDFGPVLAGTGYPGTIDEINVQYDEKDFGADLRWDVGPVVLQGEWLNHATETTRNSPSYNPGGDNSGGRSGYYVLLGVKLPYNVMPFAIYQGYRPDLNDHHTDIVAYSVGARWSVLPNLALKAEYDHYRMPDAEKAGGTTAFFFKDALPQMSFQLAWAF